MTTTAWAPVPVSDIQRPPAAASSVSFREDGLRASVEHSMSGTAMLNVHGSVLRSNAALSPMLAHPGLSLSYSIVQKHQGRIEVESEPGKGARFRIRLPIRVTLP